MNSISTDINNFINIYFELLNKNKNYVWELGKIKLNPKELEFLIAQKKLSPDDLYFLYKDKKGISGLFSIQELKIDSKIMGLKVGKINILEIMDLKKADNILHSLVEKIKESGFDLIYLRTHYLNSFVNEIYRYNFRVYGENLHVRSKFRNIINKLKQYDLSLDNRYYFTDSDSIEKDRLKNLIRNSYNLGHLFNDPKIPSQNSKEIFASWIDNLPAKNINVIAEKSSRNPVALTILVKDFEAFKVLNMELTRLPLIVVHPEYQNKNFGKILLNEYINLFSPSGIIQTGVAISNYRSLNFFLNLDFNPFSFSYIFHYWNRNY